MTPEALAILHAAAFTRERPWSATEFAGLMASPHVHLHQTPHGFALSRTVAGETELLTLAVDPAHQGLGHGRALIEAWLKSAAGRADQAFLEVASDNAAAVALYHRVGFSEAARRPRYYARADGEPADALVLRRVFTCGQPPLIRGQGTEIG